MLNYTADQLIDALLAIRTGTPVGEKRLTSKDFMIYGVYANLPENPADIQGIVDAIDNACSEMLDSDEDQSAYCMYEMTKLFKRSAQTINRWARDRRVPAYRSPEGRLLGLFPKDEIDALLSTGGVL